MHLSPTSKLGYLSFKAQRLLLWWPPFNPIASDSKLCLMYFVDLLTNRK